VVRLSTRTTALSNGGVAVSRVPSYINADVVCLYYLHLYRTRYGPLARSAENSFFLFHLYVCVHLLACLPTMPQMRVAVVQHTHTPSAAAGIALARRQLRRWHHPAVGFDHHVVLWVDNATSCGRLQEAINLTENTSCVASPTIATAFPAMAVTKQVFYENGGGPHSRMHVKRSMQVRQWAWNNCDAPYVFWFAFTRTEAYDYYWMLEWDMAWSGNLARLLASFHGVQYVDRRRGTALDDGGDSPRPACKTFPSTRRGDHECAHYNAECPEQTNRSVGSSQPKRGRKPPPCPNASAWFDWSPRHEDLLCDGGAKLVNTMYPHHNKRNRTTYPKLSRLRVCVPQLVRYSHRLLAKIAQRAGQYEHAFFCEMRAATICNLDFGPRLHAQPWRGAGGDAAAGTLRSEPACSTGRLQQRAQARFFSRTVFSWWSVVNESHLVRATSPMFFHRVKEAAETWPSHLPPDMLDTQLTLSEEE
jgi:hypothetical protein